MNRLSRITTALLAALAVSAAAYGQKPEKPPEKPAEKPTVSYVVYSRSAPDRPWFNGTGFTVEASAIKEVERLKKAGCEAYYRAELPDGTPAPSDPKTGECHVYARSSPADPWVDAGTFKSKADADAKAEALRKKGYEVFVR